MKEPYPSTEEHLQSIGRHAAASRRVAVLNPINHESQVKLLRNPKFYYYDMQEKVIQLRKSINPESNITNKQLGHYFSKKLSNLLLIIKYH